MGGLVRAEVRAGAGPEVGVRTQTGVAVKIWAGTDYLP